MKTKNNQFMTEYEVVLSKMPETFTSHDYLQQLRKTSLPKAIIEKDRHRRFLAKVCEQLTKKTWKKTSLTGRNTEPVTVQASEVTPAPALIVKAIPTESKETRINNAINLLKENGYKIYRVVEELV